MRQALADAGLPLLAATMAAASAAAAPLAATPPSSALTVGPFTIWGVDGDTVAASDFAYNATAKTITINTDKHFAIKNTDQAMASSGDEEGYLANPADVGLVIPAPRKAYIVMEGLSIKGTAPININAGAALTIILGDGTKNKLNSTEQTSAALHCPTGATLLIDDSVRNLTSDGKHITPENGLVPSDCTLANGKAVKKNDSLLELDSANPGTLYALCSTDAQAAAIGANYNGAKGAENYTTGEAGGNTTIDGGVIIAVCGTNVNSKGANAAAAIGGSYYGNGTGANEWITINGGRVTATGPYHGAGIGAGAAGASGNIRINGGYVEASGGDHSNGFGGACVPQDSSQFKIVLTGGTLLPFGSIDTVTSWSVADVGAPGLQVEVTGGSLGNDRGMEAFRFIGTATNDRGEPVRMIEIDLSSDVGQSSYPISEWQLLVDGQPYDYGAPAEFDKGHLYLWLPERIILNSEVTVDLSYLDTDNPDTNGNPRPVSPDPFFRPPGDPDEGDGKLRRYEDFSLPPAAEQLLTKPYDGTPLAGYDLAANPILTQEVGKYLNDPAFVTYRYQPYSGKNGTPLGPEVDEAGKLPTNEGVARFIMTSTQYSNDTENGFSESFWGHRATGWCEITPVASKVAAVKASWADGSSVADAQLPTKTLNVEVDVTSGDGTAATCKAPTGRVQLYVDGAPTGSPVTIEPGTNARVEKGADGREHTVVSWSFPAGDLMSPGAVHQISAKYLPAVNYLESASPDKDKGVPASEVKVSPDPAIAPVPGVAKSVENLTHPSGPTQPGDRLRYTITASNAAAGSLWSGVALSDALPACLELDSSTLHLVNAWEGIDGVPRAGDGSSAGTWALSAPGESGRRTLTVGAGGVVGGGTAVLTFECTVSANSAHAGATEAELDLANVAEATGTRPDPENPDSPMPNPDDPTTPLPVTPTPAGPVTPPGGGKVAPADPDVKISKSVENTTAPDSKMTRVGDVLRYTIELRNAGAASSCLVGAVISDPMPKGIEPVAGTLKMALPDGSSVSVPDTAYHADSRTIAVTAGDLWGGQKAVLTFDAKVTEANLGEDASNVAHAHGTIPSSEPGPGSQPTGDEPGKPAPTPPEGDGPVASTPPADPPIVVGNDPEGGQLSISKTAENKSRSDGTTHVGDKVLYTIVLRNDGPATSWMDAAIRDVVPRGLEPVSGSIKMTLPDGKKVRVADDAYKPDTRILAVAAGHLHGGKQVVLTFTAKVTKDAVGADIGNVAMAYGLPPSKWDPDGAHPEPGTPFDPPEGWGTYAHTHEQLESPTAYPPGVTSDGGVIDDGAADDGTNVIGGIKLAQTGDPNTLLAAGLTALAALAAAVMAIARRRIHRA